MFSITSIKPHEISVFFCVCLQIHHSDALPNYVCLNCWEKTEEFHKFHCSVHDAQNEYLKQIQITDFKIESELEISLNEIPERIEPNFIEVISKCDGIDEFVDENSIKVNNEFEDSEYQSQIKPIEVIYSETSLSNNVENIEQIEDESGNNTIFKLNQIFN